MAFINQDRKTSIQSDRLNLKQTPADIWEYDDANIDSTPTLSLKSPWKLNYVGIDADETISGDKLFSGANIFTGATPQVASAWVNFNGTGVVAIRDDYNVDSITDNGTGLYTVNFDVDLANANYVIAGMGSIIGSDGRLQSEYPNARTVSAVTIYTTAVPTNPVDSTYISLVVFGGV